MNLTSCDCCATVLDKDKLSIGCADLYSKEDGSINIDYYKWDGEDYVPYISCPSCGGDVIS